MKYIKLILFVAITIYLPACGVIESFVTHVYDNRPLDNTGATYHNFSQDEAMDMIMNTREAQAWNESSTSKGLFIVSTGLSIYEELSGKDCSVAQNVMNGVIDDLISDNNQARSEKAHLVGAAFYGLGRMVDYLEQKNIDADNRIFEQEFLQKQCDEDPYCDCRYRIGEDGRYEDVQKKYGFAEVQNCIRARKQAEVSQVYEEALALCAPLITQEYLDKLAIGSEQDRIERHRIIYEALQCYNQSRFAETAKRDHAGDDESTNDATMDISEEPKYPISNIILPDTPEQMLEKTKVDAYKFNSYSLSEENKVCLDNVAEILQNATELNIKLLGHTCNIGSEEANYAVGLQRAKVVKRYLVEKGIDEKRILIHSEGSKSPIVANDSPSNRALNRRVEFVIIK